MCDCCTAIPVDHVSFRISDWYSVALRQVEHNQDGRLDAASHTPLMSVDVHDGNKIVLTFMHRPPVVPSQPH